MAIAQKPTPKWVIDLHGIREALASRSNAKARVIDAIQSGEMLVMRSVQLELKNLYPNLWDEFTRIKPRAYIDTKASANALAAQLQESHGCSLLGGVPSFAHFEAVAVARMNSCQLISAGKGLSDCTSIANKCGMPAGAVGGIGAV